MNERAHEVSFSGVMPEMYDRYLVPMIFDVYAADIASRVQSLGAARVLEVAAGTGAVTRAMAASLPESVSLVATDLSPAMIDHASAVGTARPVQWDVADVMNLPYPDASFDVVVCQFGVMFLPDRVEGYREILRVLRPGGWFVFNVWDRIEHNEFAHVVSSAVADLFPADPPRFMERIPHGYYVSEVIRADLQAAGYDSAIDVHEVEARSRAATSEVVATAYCYGTPMRNFLEARGADQMAAAAAVAEAAVARAFGSIDLDARINAFVVMASAPHPSA